MVTRFLTASDASHLQYHLGRLCIDCLELTPTGRVKVVGPGLLLD